MSSNQITPPTYADFQETVERFYRQSGRHDLPWRKPEPDGSFDPYRILVSEIMLQQTQVPRVIPKFEEFLRALPRLEDLAQATLADVIRLWSGLGYNRRAKYLWQAAGAVLAEHDGVLPADQQALTALPGIGPNTAGAVLAYAFNQPVVFIETNIRSVFIHHFFAGQDKVADTQLLPLISATLPPQNVRQWYWALMDYGTHLKRSIGNTARSSAAYTKQSAFDGSRRQIRGAVLRLLAASPASLQEMTAAIADERLTMVLADLQHEGFITRSGLHYRLRA